MHRLVQGDVGSGKTVLAAAAALVALEAGYQVALMAPTEILAEQHRRNFQKWFEGLPFHIWMLTGSTSAADRRRILSDLKGGRLGIVFGTHALFESDVLYRNLGLVIVDEQHRFGVRQRAALVGKGLSPDLLVMTATPIPRTLALTAYGDLDLSVIDELPPGRKPIETKVFSERERTKLESLVLAELKKGRQAYIVFPLIDESEELNLKSLSQMFPSIVEAFKGFTVAALHGRMKADEKQQVLNDFRDNKIQVLASTTVVEVGVDAPNATMMIIEHAERFGLSQLHQLRGRVGRGAEASYCFLMASHLGSPEIVKRLRSMEICHDGFKLSEIDLEMRGPGEILGTRQSGEPVFTLARLPRDLPLLEKARADADEILSQDPHLLKYPLLRELLKMRADRVHLN
jgi:ATP-dependent DNA helicase RecG